MQDPLKARLLEELRKCGARGLELERARRTVVVDAEARPPYLARLAQDLSAEGLAVEWNGKLYAIEHTRFRVATVGRSMGRLTELEVHDRRHSRYAVRRRDQRGALRGDRVLIRRGAGATREGLPLAVIVRVIARELRDVVGFVEERRGRWVLRPYDRRLASSLPLRGAADREALEVGDWVRARRGRDVEAAAPPSGRSRGRRHELRVVEVFGSLDRPGIFRRIVVSHFGLSTEMPSAVLDEAERGASTFHQIDLARRRDLRARAAFTVDPSDAQDFDDALSARPGPDGAIDVDVHIADVAAFVGEGTEIDREARRRGLTCYLPGGSLPMLPEILSSELCSLRVAESRLAVTVALRVSPCGDADLLSIRPAVVRVSQRLDYERARELIEGGELKSTDHAASVVALRHAAEAARRLARRRYAPGAALRLDRSQHGPEGGRTRADDSHSAHQTIEMLMVTCNEVVVGWLERRGLLPVLRAHSAPQRDDIRRLGERITRHFGPSTAIDGLIGLEDDRADADDAAALRRGLQDLIEAQDVRPDDRGPRQVRSDDRRALVTEWLLQALPRAAYTTRPEGHFALASDRYGHFTSPIRRYADLVLHRLVDRALRSSSPSVTAPAGHAVRAPDERDDRLDTEEALEDLCRELNRAELRVEQAERDLRHWRKLRELAQEDRRTLDARVHGVVDAGVFVRLLESGVDALLLDDEEHGSWQVGQRIAVRLSWVDLNRRRVSVELAGEPNRARSAFSV